jgi:hypothetical protein
LPHSLRRVIKRALTPVIVTAATLYFLIDALFLPMVRRIGRALATLRLVARIEAWVRARGPYTTLALFLVPLIILEPVKPVAAYLLAKGHVTRATLVLVIGEILKITLVERLFHVGRDKLMTIPAFAWCYNFIVGWLAWLQALPPWQAVRRRLRRTRAVMRRTWLEVRDRLRRAWG